MATLILTGAVNVSAKGKPRAIGAGTEVSKVDLPDNTYGLTDRDVQRIVDAKAGYVIEDKPEPEPDAGDIDPRIATLCEAIGELEEGNADHWTNGGKPEVSALRDLTGDSVTGEERDEAWALFQKLTQSAE